MAAASSAASAQAIKIGWLSSLTGPLSSAAVAKNQGVQFAVRTIACMRTLTVIRQSLTSPGFAVCVVT